ncbi:MAG: AAA family ATPase [Gemmatimonadaceae bacterium]|nr:AAA family ATPase [Gemmatimonadaceae bacterium]
MPAHGPIDEIELLVRARHGLIVVDCPEDDRVEDVLRHVASRLSLHYYAWRRTKGVSRGGGTGDPFANDTAEPVPALGHAEREGAGIFHFPGLGQWIEDPLVAWKVRDVVDRFASRRGSLVISGPDIRLPEILRPHATFVRLPPPAHEEYRALFERVIRDHQARMPLRVELGAEERARLLYNLTGMSLVESERILTRILIEDGAVTAADIARVAAAKRKIVEQEGLLEYWTAEETMASVAGLEGLKAWLAKRRAAVEDPEGASAFGLPFPKGMLLLGVPGCGKSLCAKAVASEWRLPLLRLDPGALFDKYVGDTEKNFRRAMRTAERMAPVVLWIDEIEKAFAPSGGDQDGGVSQRVFGSFLAWLQERSGDVFVVATSNDVSRLPPEFIRKGRFDEVFFVDLPTRVARTRIFDIHLRKRRVDPAGMDLEGLAGATAGFSGAEIEQVVISALFTAFAARHAVSTEILMREVAATHPLSRTMAERLAALRAWARDRTVNADSAEWRSEVPAPARATAATL